MENLNAEKVQALSLLRMEIEQEFDGEEVLKMNDEQCRVIATAYHLLASRANTTKMVDQLIMLLANQDPELDWARHTIKNLARFLNAVNHPALRTH